MKRQEKDELKGLTRVQVENRREMGLDNREVKAPSKSVGQIIASNLFTYFNLIFLIIAILLILVHSYRDLTFLPIIIANTLIGIVQELRAKQVLDKLNLMNIPRVWTLRDGEEREVSVHELVKDDVVRLEAGNQIPADARVIQGQVMVNEALLTGEADEVKKEPGATLMSGSFVVSGKCYARLEKVGDESYASKLILEAKAMKQGEQSEIIRSLNKIVKVAGVAIIPIGIVLFCQQFFGEGHGMQVSVQAMVAAVIGMIPEGLFLLASVTLVVSAMKMAQRQVLLHDMKSIEILARVDTLCVDKTGTITEEKMRLVDVISFDKGHGKSLEGEAVKPGEEGVAHLSSSVARGELRNDQELLWNFAMVQEADNATMVALKEGLEVDKYRKLKVTEELGEVKKVVGFSSRYKYSAVEFEQETLVLGAPEFVLGKEYGKYEAEVEKYSEEGYRVLVFGRYDGELDGKALKGKVEADALVLLANPIRENAAETFRYFYEQGVEIKVISGDNPVTVAKVAEQAGIKVEGKYIDATKLKTKKEIQEAVMKYTVFGRVTPEQKRKFVQALKAVGRTVAMTGDGVNDVLALKDADCSIAMASGSEAAVQAAQLVLLDSDFAKMPDVVHEGRKVVNNLERSGSLFLVKNIFSFLTALLTIIFGMTYPLTPSQVSLVSMFTIGLPAFLLSQVPNTALIRGNFAKNIIARAFPGGVTDMVLIVIMMFVGEWLGVDGKELATVATILMAMIGLMVLFDISRPMDWEKRFIWWLSAIGLGLSISFLRPLFGITGQLGWTAVLLLVGFGILAWPMLIGLKRVVRYFTKKNVVQLN